MSSLDLSSMSDLALSPAAQVDIQAQQQRIQNLSNASDPKEKEQELREASEGFEAIFLQQMLEQMRATLPKSDLLKSKEQEHWDAMFDEELAKSLASAGGIGLADMMMGQLMQKETYTSTPEQDMSQASKEVAIRRTPMEVPPASLTAEINAASNNTDSSRSIQMQASNNPMNTQNSPYNTEGVSTGATVAQDPNSVANALEELQGLVDAKVPRVVNTVYTTNLPADERKNALFDSGKEPTAILRTPQALQTSQASPILGTAQTNSSQNQAGSLLSFSSNGVQNAAQNRPNIQATSITGSTNISNVSSDDLSSLLEMAPYPTSEQVEHPELANLNQNANTANISNVAGIYGTSNELGGVSTDILTGIAATYIPYSSTPSSPITAGRDSETNIAPQANSIPKTQVIYAQADLTDPTDPIVQANQTIQLAQAQNVQTTQAVQSIQTVASNTIIQNISTQNTGGSRIIRSVGQNSNIQASHAMAPADASMQMPITGEITSVFGWRIDPFTGQRAWHTGLDIKAPEGSSVRAAQDGTVIFAGKDKDLGNMIVLDHGNGIQSIYGHNSDLQVSEGMEIKLGTEIAKVGSSGRAYGRHLHFEVRQSDLPINPEPLLRQGFTSLASR